MAENGKPNQYNPKERENHWRKFWVENGTYRFNSESDKEIFSIDTPPPTVSGRMHIGHVYSYTQQDIIARFKRMRGKNVFYPFGTDDNGLPTERLIEKLENVKATKMERSEFIDLCNKKLKEILPDFIEDWKRIGQSCDFDLYYSTIDDNSRRISQKSFIDLYNMGRAYQLEAPVVWCPSCQTAIAQVEMEDEEHPARFCDIVFKLPDGKDLIISTTRPEMLASCAAIFVNPEDERYKELVGQKAKVPLYNQEVPIMIDPRAQIDKGTGAVMCCTFGDSTDIEWYKAHKLPLVLSIDKAGRMTDSTGKYQGMTAEEARSAIIADLEEAGLKVGERNITHTVNVHERCKTPVEILESKQWFIKYLDLKERFKQSGAELNWHPRFMKGRLDNWIDGLQWDWCISRQRFFGIPFPVWYCQKCGAIKLAEIDDLPVDPTADKPKGSCAKCGSSDFRPELDVLDTWATSSLTPQIAISLASNKIDRDKLFPMSLRPQAHDIISFWLFNTLVKSILHEDKNPWKDVMISGWVLDPKGRKMSKSLGNVVEPDKVLETYGADAVRYWAAGGTLGQDISYSEDEIKVGKKTVTKLWNAANFTLSQLENLNPQDFDRASLLSEDRWILAELQTALIEYTKAFDNYEYYKAREVIQKFFWDKLCDNYLEFTKYRMYREGDSPAKDAAKYTLYIVLRDTLKMFAPMMPFITEEIYQTHYINNEGEGSIHSSQLPDADESMIDRDLMADFDDLLKIVSAVRGYKSSHGLSLKKELAELILETKNEKLKEYSDFLRSVLIIQSITFSSATQELSPELKIDIKE